MSAPLPRTPLVFSLPFMLPRCILVSLIFLQDNELIEVDWFNGSKIKMHPGSIIFAPEEKDSN